MWETSPHPRAGDERDGDGEEGLPLPAAGAEVGQEEGAWLGCHGMPGVARRETLEQQPAVLGGAGEVHTPQKPSLPT